jgi:hypothetical protein
LAQRGLKSVDDVTMGGTPFIDDCIILIGRYGVARSITSLVDAFS